MHLSCEKRNLERSKWEIKTGQLEFEKREKSETEQIEIEKSEMEQK